MIDFKGYIWSIPVNSILYGYDPFSKFRTASPNPEPFPMTNTRPAPMFIADARGLDFLNTVAAPWGSNIEWLGHGQDLLAWLEQAGLVEASVAKMMRTNTIPGELDALAAQARILREWFRSFVLAHAGRQINPNVLSELSPLNRLLQRDEAFCEIARAESETGSR